MERSDTCQLRLVVPQAQDVARQRIGLIGRDDQIRHVLVAGLQEHLQRKRGGAVALCDGFEARGRIEQSGHAGLDRVARLAPRLRKTMPLRCRAHGCPGCSAGAVDDHDDKQPRQRDQDGEADITANAPRHSHTSPLLGSFASVGQCARTELIPIKIGEPTGRMSRRRGAPLAGELPAPRQPLDLDRRPPPAPSASSR